MKNTANVCQESRTDPDEKLLDTGARPAENVKEIQKKGQPVSYDSKATSTVAPKPQPPPKREEEQR